MSRAADLRSRRKATGCSKLQCSGLSAKPGTPTMAGLVITTWRRCQRRGSGNPATPGTWAEATISRGRYLSPFTQPQPWPSIRTAIIVYLLRDAQDVPVQFCQWTILLLLQVAAYNGILTSPTAFFTIIYEKFWYILIVNTDKELFRCYSDTVMLQTSYQIQYILFIFCKPIILSCSS